MAIYSELTIAKRPKYGYVQLECLEILLSKHARKYFAPD